MATTLLRALAALCRRSSPLPELVARRTRPCPRSPRRRSPPTAEQAATILLLSFHALPDHPFIAGVMRVPLAAGAPVTPGRVANGSPSRLVCLHAACQLSRLMLNLASCLAFVLSASCDADPRGEAGGSGHNAAAASPRHSPHHHPGSALCNVQQGGLTCALISSEV